MQNLKKVLIIMFIVLFLFVSFYFFMPVMAWGFTGFLYITFVITVVLAFMVNDIFAFKVIVVNCSLFVSIMIITSWSLFYSGEYKQLIGEVEESIFTQDVTPIDISHIRIVDQSVAYRVGEKLLGKDPSLGSRAKLGIFAIQQINGELYWIAPVVHSGFWKWKKFLYTPGYVKVSATNPRDVEYITHIGKQKLNLRYQNEAYFSDNLKRHLYMNGYMTKGLTDYTFEVRDDGKPFWVVTVYNKAVGFFGENAIGVVTVDPINGDISKFYKPEEAPVWIDRIQPENFITTQLNDWGNYINGWLNQTMFGAKDGILKTTPGMSLVYGKDGKSYWYSGIASIGKEGSSVGFVLVDTRTKKVHWYKQAGATETKAQGSAEGKVQEKRYIASFPVLYNVSGVPTYVMSLKDAAGLIKMIAMVSVEDYGIVGVGNSIRDSLRSYRSELASKGNAISPDSGVNRVKVKAKVVRFASDIRNGETFYYIMIKGFSDKLFIATSETSQEVPITVINDTVYMEFMDGGNGVIDILSFDNRSINLAVTDKQSEVISRFEKVKTRKQNKHDANQADSNWGKLSPAEKAKVLQNMKKSK